jgi:hypothetical protein
VDGTESDPQLVTAALPSGELVKIEIAGRGSDGMTSVGLRDLDLTDALQRVSEIGSLVMEKLRAAKPAKTTVELRLGFALEAGKLTALWVGAKGDASLTVTMEWGESSSPEGGPVAATEPASSADRPADGNKDA